MTGSIELLGTRNNEPTTIDDHIKCAEPFRLIGERRFEYDLDDKATKAKLVKGSKRAPFLVEENSTSSNLIFSTGSWFHIALPSVRY